MWLKSGHIIGILGVLVGVSHGTSSNIAFILEIATSAVFTHKKSGLLHLQFIFMPIMSQHKYVDWVFFDNKVGLIRVARNHKGFISLNFYGLFKI